VQNNRNIHSGTVVPLRPNVDVSRIHGLWLVGISGPRCRPAFIASWQKYDFRKKKKKKSFNILIFAHVDGALS